MSYKKYQIYPFRQNATKNGVLVQNAVSIVSFLPIISFRQIARIFCAFLPFIRV